MECGSEVEAERLDNDWLQVYNGRVASLMYLPVAEEASLGRSFPSMSLGVKMESPALTSISPRRVSSISPRRVSSISPRHVTSISPRHVSSSPRRVSSLAKESNSLVANERRLSAYLSKPGSNSSASTRCTRPGSNSSESDVSNADEYSNVSEDMGSASKCHQSVTIMAAQTAHQTTSKLQCPSCTKSAVLTTASSPLQATGKFEAAAQCQAESKCLLSATIATQSPNQVTGKHEGSACTTQNEDAAQCHESSLAPLVCGFVSARVRQHEDLISLSLGAKSQSFAAQSLGAKAQSIAVR